MAGSVNKVILIGNLGGDPETRTYQSGNRVCNLRLATTEYWKDRKTGEKRERTQWHTVAIYVDQLIGIAEQYLRKGARVYIEGKLEHRKWQDQSGQDKYWTEVAVRSSGDKMLMVDRREGGAGGGEYGYGAGRSDDVVTSDPGSGSGYSNLDDEIPF